MLMLNYGLTGYVAQQRERCWQGHAWSGLRGRTALILGLGNIGRAVAAHCQYLGMHVLGLRRSAAEVAGVDELVAAEALHAALARCDVLCLHVPLTQHTRGLIDRAEFAALKPGALVVNTARGGVMVEGALHDALRDGRVRGAFVDVFEQEPLPPDSPLWDAPNLFISPHMADTVSDYEQRFTDFFADNLQRWLDGEALHNVVDPIAGY
jgi:phosphoglycerate dehydrogenase-like enzyme